MKKIVTVVIVLVLLLVVAPFGVGKLAEKRLNHGLDKLTENAPYLKVVERKWTSGWFKSEQVVTFEAFGSWMEAFKNKALEEAANDAVAGSESGSENNVEPGDASDAQPPEGDPPLADLPAEAAVAEVADPEQPFRFTIRNEILHGPVLGVSGFGVARVNTYFIMSEKTRKEIAEIFGPKEPVEISTRVGFFGGGTTTFKSEGRVLKPKGEKTEISWETFKLAIGYSGNPDKYDVDGKWPKFEVKDLANGTHFVMTDMTLDGDGKRVKGDLYDGDFTFAIDKMNVEAKGNESFEIGNLHYVASSASKGEFTEMGARLGIGAVKSKQLAGLGVELKEIHYDFSMRRLHTDTLVKMLAGLKSIYSKPFTDPLEAEKVFFAPFKEHGAELLKYDPEFVIERIGIVTPEGDGYIKGVVTLKGAVPDDFGAGKMSLIGKIHADITIDVSEKMLQKLPNGSTGAGAAVDSGYAKREGDRLICKIIFDKGQLTVNGKPQQIPGLGGPPPSEGDEVPSPQE